ncbi:MAG: polymer-forming cytoskeletal protein [Myxococcales bacterium]|nr:MAG: polymer-forming cytoskeletal protein [Myxococcales bacterium]
MQHDPQDLTGLGQLAALLGPETVFEGKLCFQDKVRIEGKVIGEIHGKGTLILAGNAEIQGQIHVGTLIMRSGTIRGNIHARSLVEAHEPARIEGDIHAPQILIEKGVVFEGKCTMPQAERGEPAPYPIAKKLLQ